LSTSSPAETICLGHGPTNTVTENEIGTCPLQPSKQLQKDDYQRHTIKKFGHIKKFTFMKKL
jgi:hypothetical protein